MLGGFRIGALSFYFSFLVSFSFVTHPLGYCILLVGGALCLSFLTLLCCGLSWYLALFVLVYVGGVYVLFLFVSVHNSNSSSVLGGSSSFYIFLFFFFFLFLFFFFEYVFFFEDESRFLCSSVEGLSYLVLCFSLLVGFGGVSMVSGQKDSFFR